MSKTLFNQNTFQNKNVTNDGDIAELTKATEDIAANTAAIAGKQDILTTGEGINISVLPSTTTIKFDGSALSSDIVSSGDITGIELKYTDVNGVVKSVEEEIDGKQNDLTAGDGIDIDGSDEISLSGTRTGNFIITGNFESSGTEYKLWNETRGGTGTSHGRALVHTGSGTKETSILRVNYTDDFGGGTQIDSIVGIAKPPDSAYDLDVNGNVNIGGVLSLPNVSNVAGAFQTLSDEDAYMLGLFDGKQDTLTDADNAGTNISISTEGVISATGTTYTAGDGIDIDGSNQISFNGIMSQTIVTSGSITGATMNYVDNGVVTNIQTEIERKQDILTNADNAGDNITISATGVISSTDTTYSDTGTGAILVDGTTISLDFSRTDAEIECPQKFRIEKDGTPQFLVSADPDRGSDVGDGASAVITIRGQRMNTTTQRAAQLRFENRDYSLSNTRDLFELAGKVTNDTTNIGGMLISNYADGQTRTENTTMSADGNWYFGGGGAFQDTYKVEIGGSLNVNSPVYRIPQQIFYNFNIQSMAGSTSPSGTNRFGEESYFNSVASTRTLGDSFCSINNGTITFSQSGFYKIRVSANSQTFGYDNRTAFGVYLNINGTEYWENRNYNFFGWTYTRNRTDGAHGNITLEDCIYIASSHTLQVRTKIDIDNLNFDNSLGVNQMRCYTNLQIERIATTDIS